MAWPEGMDTKASSMGGSCGRNKASARPPKKGNPGATGLGVVDICECHCTGIYVDMYVCKVVEGPRLLVLLPARFSWHCGKPRSPQPWAKTAQQLGEATLGPAYVQGTRGRRFIDAQQAQVISLVGRAQMFVD